MKVLLGCFRMAVWSAIVGRLLEQETGSAGSSRIGGYFHHDGRDHPLHARWLGRHPQADFMQWSETSLPAPYGHYRAAVARRSLPGCHSEQDRSAHRNESCDCDPSADSRRAFSHCICGRRRNKFLAKVASDWRKPDGLFVIQPKDVDTFLPPFSVARMPGVGTVTEARLKQIQTVGDLRAFERASL